MPLALRLTAPLALVAVVLLAVGFDFSRLDHDAWDWPDAQQALARARTRGAELDGILSGLERRYQAKCTLAAELADGRLTLAEAVARFHALVPDPALFREGLRMDGAGASDEERLWRHVTDWALSLVADDAERAALAVGLEGELQRYLTPGRSHFPPPRR
jgi:hypothetical protein